MSRGVGAVEALQAVLPEWAVPVVNAVTQLGDVWFVFLLVPALYWFGPSRGWLADREDAGLFAGLALVALALVVALKALFAVPRPPEALRLVATDGYGFPSGHAIASTAIYGGLGVLLDRWTVARRIAVAAVVVAAVALSRVLLGLHYLVDVVAGVGVSLLVLGAVVALRRRDRGAAPLLWFGAVVGVAAVVVSAVNLGSVSQDAAMAGGATVGAALAWTWLDRRDAEHVVAPVTAGVALVVLGGVFGAVQALEPAVPVVVVANLVVFVGIVGLPGVEGVLSR